MGPNNDKPPGPDSLERPEVIHPAPKITTVVSGFVFFQ